MQGIIIFTDGSKINTSVSFALTINIGFHSFKLQEGLSISLICTDSSSGVKALKYSVGDHPLRF